MSRPAKLFLFIGLISLGGCKQPTRAEIDATIWLNNAPIPAALCSDKPELLKYGFYRRLNTGNLEFISFCDARASAWLAIFKDDLQRLLDKYVPTSEQAQLRAPDSRP